MNYSQQHIQRIENLNEAARFYKIGLNKPRHGTITNSPKVSNIPDPKVVYFDFGRLDDMTMDDVLDTSSYKSIFEFFVENDVCLYHNNDEYDDVPKEDEEFWKEVDVEETRRLDYKNSSVWQSKLLNFQSILEGERDSDGY